MSSSSVCQGLQSCLEPRLMEHRRVLRLKLTPSKSNFSGSISPSSEPQSHMEENTTPTTTIIGTNNQNDDSDMMKSENTEETIRGWSFLECLTNTNTNTTKERGDDDDDGNNDKVYIHPLAKRSSSSKLSEKSLEMCTESLGSETGSSLLVSESSDVDDSITTTTTISSPEIITTGIIINCSSSSSSSSSSQMKEMTNDNSVMMTKRTNNRSVSFPPPLTSIGGSTGVQVRPHREGGRLVLKAVTVSSSPTFFHAERSDGRLRLRLVKHLHRPSCPNEDDDEDEDEEEEEFDEEDEDCCDDSEGVDGESGKVRDEIGIEKLGRSSSRCNEGHERGAGNKLWEPFWVAT